MKNDIPTFTPNQVRKKFLIADETLNKKLKEDISLFSISRIEEMRPYINIPNAPFRNTSNGFIFVLTGYVKISVDVLQHTLFENIIAYTSAGKANSIEEIHPDTTGYFITFHEDFFDNSQLSTALNKFSELLKPDSFLMVELSAGVHQIILSMCNRMIDLYHNADDKLSLAKQYLLTILSELNPIFNAKKRFVKANTPRLVVEFKDTLLTKINNNPKPADMAKILNVSVNHLNKVLKLNTQLSTTEWIAKRQIIEAKLLLRNSQKSITEIAFYLGFDDPSYFSRFFQKHTKVTPSHYRKNKVD